LQFYSKRNGFVWQLFIFKPKLMGVFLLLVSFMCVFSPKIFCSHLKIWPKKLFSDLQKIGFSGQIFKLEDAILNLHVCGFFLRGMLGQNFQL